MGTNKNWGRYAFLGAILVFLAGCESSTTMVSSFEPDETGGTVGFAGAENTAGQKVEETGGIANISGSGPGGTGNSVSTGGSSDETGGENTGGTAAETGGTAGTGGELPTGGTGTGGELPTGGTSGTGGTIVCNPKTCLTIAVELSGGVTDPVPDACGLVDDGCGNLIDCGGCAEGSTCGAGIPDSHDMTIETNAIEHLCGGDCVPSAEGRFTDDNGDIWFLWNCTGDYSPIQVNSPFYIQTREQYSVCYPDHRATYACL